MIHDNFLRPPAPSEHRIHKHEDEYFARRDAELINALRDRLDAERRDRERHSHHMKCPNCGADLKEMSYAQVKVDRCSECGGAWLDKGELEMVLRTQPESGMRMIVADLLGLRLR